MEIYNQGEYEGSVLQTVCDYIENPIDLIEDGVNAIHGGKCSGCNSCGGGCYGCKVTPEMLESKIGEE